ncbi:MAG TPA: DUF192 domain-containing protein [Saprospirales bacterium]|nr:DUF192 domain-containing protein [Saprospirales bacterium]
MALRICLPFLVILFGFMACKSDPPQKTIEKPLSEGVPPVSSTPAEVPAPPFVQEGVLEFRAPGGAQSSLRVDIEIAHDVQERTQGLMWRKKMEEKQAMLFIFDYCEPQSFWMRNTYIPLDIIYVNDQFEVVTVLKNVPVLNDQPRPSGKPAQYVIEVNAGVSDKFKIVPGTIVAWQDYIFNRSSGPFKVDAFK